MVADLLALPAGERPTALFTSNNRNTVGALKALRATGDEPRSSASTTSSSPTCSARPSCGSSPPPWGAQASALAFARLDGDDRPPQTIVVPTELVARGLGERPTDREAAAPAAQPAAPLLPRRAADRRPAGHAARGRPHARGVDRLRQHVLRRSRGGPQPPRGRHARARRDRRRPRGVPRPRARLPLRHRPRAARQAARRGRAPAGALPPRQRVRARSTSTAPTARRRRG